MMTPQERAKIFMPFDALKGLQEALRDREERYSREEKREISEERVEQISRVLQKLKPGMKVEIRYYCAFHEVKKIGIVSGIDVTYKKLKLDSEWIWFDDIYSLRITDY